MAKYVCKRLGYAILTIFLISVITFTVMNLIPGGPFLSEKAVTPATQAALEAKYGLDVPKPQQYLNYMNGLLHGDFGESLKQKGRTANDIIFSTFPVSARLGGISILVALVAGVGLGSVAAMCRGKWGDQLIMVVSTFRDCCSEFCCGYRVDENLWCRIKVVANDGFINSAALHPTCVYACVLSNGLHHTLDAFQYAGCPQPGLYPYSAGERRQQI